MSTFYQNRYLNNNENKNLTYLIECIFELIQSFGIFISNNERKKECILKFLFSKGTYSWDRTSRNGSICCSFSKDISFIRC
jgi:hypothetical protein